MAKKRKKYSIWKAEDIVQLVSLRETKTIKECASILNKSVISVKKKLAQIKSGNISTFGVKPYLPVRKSKLGLTWQTVNQIRVDWISNQFTLAQLKEKYKMNVWNIISNTVWKDSEYVPPRKIGKRRKKENLCLDNTLLL